MGKSEGALPFGERSKKWSHEQVSGPDFFVHPSTSPCKNPRLNGKSSSYPCFPIPCSKPNGIGGVYEEVLCFRV